MTLQIESTPISSPLTVSGAPPANANQAALQVGGGSFAGGGAPAFSGAAAGTGLGINVTTGADLINAQVSGVQKFKVDGNGVITALSAAGIVIGNAAGSTYLSNSGSAWYFAMNNQQMLYLRNGPALGQGTVEVLSNGQATGNDFAQLQVTAGTITMNASPATSGVVRLQQVTYSAAAAQTGTDVATLIVEGAPIAGTNFTFTRKYQAWFKGTDNIRIDSTTASTVGAAGAASALPAQPLGYLPLYVGATLVKVPYYNP